MAEMWSPAYPLAAIQSEVGIYYEVIVTLVAVFLPWPLVLSLLYLCVE